MFSFHQGISIPEHRSSCLANIVKQPKQTVYQLTSNEFSFVSILTGEGKMRHILYNIKLSNSCLSLHGVIPFLSRHLASGICILNHFNIYVQQSGNFGNSQSQSLIFTHRHPKLKINYSLIFVMPLLSAVSIILGL